MSTNTVYAPKFNLSLELLLKLAPEFYAKLGITVTTCVVDTNVLLNDVSRYVKKGEPTGIMRAAKAATVRFFVSPTVVEEVLEHLPKTAQRNELPVEPLLAAWQTYYEPYLVVVDPVNIPLGERERRLQGRDPDDVPLARVVTLTGPDVLLSEDTDLLEFGAVGNQWTRVSAALRDQAECDELLIEFAAGGVLVSVAVRGLQAVAAEALRSLLKVALPLFRRVPQEVVVLGLILAVAALAHPDSRGRIQAVQDRLVQQLGPQGKVLLNLGLDAAQRYLAALEVKDKTSTFLQQCGPTMNASQTLLDGLAHVLSKSLRALTLAEIENAMLSHPTRQPQFPTEVSKQLTELLGKNPNLFKPAEGGRWQFSLG